MASNASVLPSRRPSEWTSSGTFHEILKSSLARESLKAGDVVWTGAYLGFLIRKKNSNRWVVEYFGFSNQTGSEKINNIIAFHVGDFVHCIKDEDTPATKRSNIWEHPIRNGDPWAAASFNKPLLQILV
ncbi:hypothetical protein B9Z55_008910 [Caenorhabditis nigoni]|nr:hypothetical protein B9Z55_008910 [Caenorhabditis nigoni]